jgi:hypothetical protein
MPSLSIPAAAAAAGTVGADAAAVGSIAAVSSVALPTTLAGVATTATTAGGLSLGTLASGAGLIGSGISALGSIEQGQAAQAQANYQAQVAQNNAITAGNYQRLAVAQGNEKAEQTGIQVANQIGQTRAAYGAGEIDPNSGSALAVQEGQKQVGELSQANAVNQGQLAGYGYSIQATQFESQSALDTFSGQQAAEAGEVGAAGSALQGLGTFGARYAYLNGTTSPSGGGAGATPFALTGFG